MHGCLFEWRQKYFGMFDGSAGGIAM